jgi:hypothetical protein
VKANASVDRIAYLERAARAERAEASGAYQELVVDDADLERGLATGALATDHRLRDVLEALLDGASGEFVLPAGGEEIEFDAPSLVDDALFAADVAVTGEADVIRVQRRLDGLEQRLRVVESMPSARLVRRARWLARRARAVLPRRP